MEKEMKTCSKCHVEKGETEYRSLLGGRCGGTRRVCKDCLKCKKKGPWHKDYSQCVNCGTTDLVYRAAGECSRCHQVIPRKDRKLSGDILICLTCGNEFFRHLSRIKLGEYKYCSSFCSNTRSNRFHKTVVCDICDKVFYRSPSEVARERHKYCSSLCRQKASKEKLNCINCRKLFVAYKTNNRLLCSRKCSSIYRRKSPLASDGKKKCLACLKFKKIDLFNNASDTKDHLKTICKDCVSVRGLMRTYNLSLKQLMALSSVCNICGEKNFLKIDHDHITGKTRDRLCRNCNWGLGNFKDNTLLLHKAAEYVDRHNKKGGEKK